MTHTEAILSIAIGVLGVVGLMVLASFGGSDASAVPGLAFGVLIGLGTYQLSIERGRSQS